MSRYKSLVPMVIIGTGIAMMCNSPKNSLKSKWHDILYKEENVFILEDILKEERTYFEHIPPAVERSDSPEEDAIPIFNKQIKHHVEDFLNIPEFENPRIISSRKNPKNLALARTGLFIGCLSSLGAVGYLLLGRIRSSRQIRERKRPSAYDIRSGIKGIFFGTMGLININLSLNIYHSNNYIQDLNEVNISYVNTNGGAIVDTPEKLAIVLTHEVTHSLQYRPGIKIDSTMKEGHEEGVARNVGKILYDETKDPAFVEQFRTYDRNAFATIYIDICKDVNRKPNKELIRDLDSSLALEEHTIGFTLFAIREHQWGDRIYRDVLEGDYCRIFHSPEEKICE